MNNPIYAVSDLHMGDGGPRDNFTRNEKTFLSFLDMVEDHHGSLVICGDFFELWQSNMSKVLTMRETLLNRLAQMAAVYVVGNHDADLKYFIGRKGWISHPFFDHMCLGCAVKSGDRLFHFIHGHEADPYCLGDTPGLGRITAIYSGLKEDRNGSPMLDKYLTVEDRVIGRMEWFVSIRNWFRRKPDRFKEINHNLHNVYLATTCDSLVCGHTHRPGHNGTWLYNCGTWAQQTNSFVRINGEAKVFDWVNRDAVINDTILTY